MGLFAQNPQAILSLQSPLANAKPCLSLGLGGMVTLLWVAPGGTWRAVVGKAVVTGTRGGGLGRGARAAFPVLWAERPERGSAQPFLRLPSAAFPAWHSAPQQRRLPALLLQQQ